jgi:hypothetical protein
MKRKPIYVELKMKTDMDRIWACTQKAELHQQWDLRFSSITYLPRKSEVSPQFFRYQTRIGFGLLISGTGLTRSSINEATGVRVSTLAFGSDQPISLIRHGAGYWQYRPDPQDDSISFITKYNYETRFGVLGQWFDRILFRPMFGWATAWSFDVLRLWLEKQIPPAVSIQRAIIHYLSVILLCFLWLYEGIVPKWMYPGAGELEVMQSIGMFAGYEPELLKWLGGAEIILGGILVGFHRKRSIFNLQIGLLLGLAVGAIAGSPSLLAQPFNPVVLSVGMIGLCIIAHLTIRDLPRAGHCIRIMPTKPKGEQEQ